MLPRCPSWRSGPRAACFVGPAPLPPPLWFSSLFTCLWTSWPPPGGWFLSPLVCSQALSPPDSPKRSFAFAFPSAGNAVPLALGWAASDWSPFLPAASSSLQRVPLSGLEPAQGHSPQWHSALSVSIFFPGLLSACHHVALSSIESSMRVRPASGLLIIASQCLPVPPQCIA